MRQLSVTTNISVPLLSLMDQFESQRELEGVGGRGLEEKMKERK